MRENGAVDEEDAREDMEKAMVVVLDRNLEAKAPLFKPLTQSVLEELVCWTFRAGMS